MCIRDSAMSRAEVVDMAVGAVKLIKQLAAEQPATEWVLSLIHI